MNKKLVVDFDPANGKTNISALPTFVISEDDNLLIEFGQAQQERDSLLNEMIIPSYFDVKVSFLNGNRTEAVSSLLAGMSNTQYDFPINQRKADGSSSSVVAEWCAIECDANVKFRVSVY